MNLLYFRIQKKEFANLTVVTTRRKGFGLRAEENISQYVAVLSSSHYLTAQIYRGSLVCEYTGEVVNGQQAENRLKKYMSNKRNKHIYMMELQKGEVSPDFSHSNPF
jgi:[histone H3]-lysine36 N-trimethyltransferase